MLRKLSRARLSWYSSGLAFVAITLVTPSYAGPPPAAAKTPSECVKSCVASACAGKSISCRTTISTLRQCSQQCDSTQGVPQTAASTSSQGECYKECTTHTPDNQPPNQYWAQHCTQSCTPAGVPPNATIIWLGRWILSARRANLIGAACISALGVLGPGSRAQVIPKPGGGHGPMPNPPVGLMITATGTADVASACKGPLHFDRQVSPPSSAPLTSVWSGQCSDHAAETAASLEGAAAYDSLTAIATGSYKNTVDEYVGVTATNANVVVGFSDQLRFELTNSAPASLKNANCGITTGSQRVDWLCISVKVTMSAGFFSPSYDSVSAGLSNLFSISR